MTEKKLEPPSELFERVLMSSGHLTVDCELCHRTHFATASPGNYDEGELEGLRAKAKQHPDQYIEDAQNDGISAGTLSGIIVVLGCQCNILRKYEDIFWENRGLIMDYIKRRVLEQRKSVERDEKLIAEAGSAT